MKKNVICIILIIFLFAMFIMQQVNLSAADLTKGSSGISSLSGSMPYVSRVFSDCVMDQVQLRTLFLYVLYIAIFIVMIRLASIHRHFIRRYSLRNSIIFYMTTMERESDA